MPDPYAEIFTTPQVEQHNRFPDFWKAWPDHERKVARLQCEAKWKAKKLDRLADRIIAHVERMKLTDTWAKGFVPLPATYLNQNRWEGSAQPLVGVKSDAAEKTQAYLESRAQIRCEDPARVAELLKQTRQRLAK